MRLALDTNGLAYAEGVNGPARKKETLQMLVKLSQEEIFIPAQTLGELVHVLTRKAGRAPERARDARLGWQDAYPAIETSGPVLIAASDLAAHHKLGIWDSVVLAGAAAAGCRLLSFRGPAARNYLEWNDRGESICGNQARPAGGVARAMNG